MNEDIASGQNGDKTDSLDVILIGAGLGGLTCAIDLARQGLKVCVLEQHRVAGGYAHGFRRKGYHFDVSLHFSGGLDPGCTTHGILESLGVLNKLRLVRAKDVFSAEYPDLNFAWPNDPGQARDKLVKLFKAEQEGIDALFALLPRIKEDVIGPLMIPDFARASVPGDGLQSEYSQKTFSQILDQHISDPTLKAIFGQMWGYVGLPPSRSAATYSTCVFSAVCLEGSYQIVGGSAALARALVERLRELGGDCLVKTPVDRIVVEDGEVTGVETEAGRFMAAPIVVSSASPHQTFGKMISGDELSRVFRYRLEKMETSLSMFSMYMGLDCTPSSLGINPGNHFINYGVDKDAAYEAVLKGDIDNTEWCMTNNEGIDDVLHPPGCGIVSALELAPSDDWLDLDDEKYAVRKEEVRKRLLAKYERRYPGLSSHIAVCELGTPRTMARFTRSHKGAVYGLAQTVEQSSGKRLRNRTPIHGLFLTGAWTWAGGGYEGAMMSGIQTSGVVMREGDFEAPAPRVRLHPDPVPSVAPPVDTKLDATAIPHDLDPETENRHYRFNLPIRVYGDDLNSRGHVDASSLVRYMDRARCEAIEEICLGLKEESWLDQYQITVYRVDARCATVVGLADELEVRTGLRRISTHRASFDQRIVNKATGALVVDAGVEVLFLDADKKLAPVPDGLIGCDCELHDFLSERPERPPFTDADKFPFRTPFRVYFEDTDLQQITYHVSYVRFCERALFDMIRTVWPDMKASVWMQKHKSNVAGFDVRYLNSSTLGDRLEVLTGVTGMDKYKVTMGQRIILAGTSKVLVDTTTEVEFRDEAEQIVPIPKQLVDVTMANLFPNGPPGGGAGGGK